MTQYAIQKIKKLITKMQIEIKNKKDKNET